MNVVIDLLRCSLNVHLSRFEIPLMLEQAFVIIVRDLVTSFIGCDFFRAGGSGNGRAVPLMEFLNRKSEKRGSLQVSYSSWIP